ncbi:Ribosome biogenesis ATPase rix7 [Pseudogymnoascus australis]
MPIRTGQRPSLTQSLDREQIYQVVRKIADEQAEREDGGKRLSTSTVYDSIKNSNSSLKRRPKKLLEDSIDRVLLVIKEEQDDSEASLDGDFEGIADAAPVLKEHNVMNRSITKLWAQPKASLTPNTQSDALTTGQTTPSTPTQAIDGDATTPGKADRHTNGEPHKKRRKADKEPKKEVDRNPPADISLANLGGVDAVIEELNELVAMPMLYPETYLRTGIQPPRGVLLHGPPGCGKTMIANAFAAEIGVSFIPISAPSLVAGMSGESEKKIREIFDEAKKMAPCLVFIDEIDVIMGKRESAQREMEKRIVAQMLTCMDDMALEKTDGKPVIIIAATNRPDSIDPALRRAGRFNKEINLGVPNEASREKILRALTQKLVLPDDFDFLQLAKMTPGFVGADLNDVVSVAGTEAMKRMMTALKQRVVDTPLTPSAPPTDHAGETPPDGDFSITYSDFLAAVPKVQPSARREGFATIPDTTWAHIGALHTVREQLTMAIIEPIRRPAAFARVGITAPTGVLLWGPPGCGKTLLAKAVANESKANFISIKGPELLNKYVGESERAVRQVFERARSSVPCILFFDELDALVPKREDSLSEASSKVVNTLLTELDGLSSRAGIYVVAATNRPDMIDPAMLRPGRLGTSVFIDLPNADERVEILRALYAKALPGAAMEGLEAVARDARAEGYSGADLGNLHQAAAVAALRRDGGSEEVRIESVDWEMALGSVKPSVKDAGKYRRLKERGM